MKRTTLILAVAVMAVLAIGTEAAWAGTWAAVRDIPAGSSHTWVYSAGTTRIVRVALKGDGDTDLDVYVYNSQGLLVARDTGLSDFCCVRFWALRGNTYRIVVVNHGSVYNRCVMRIDN